MALGNAGSQGGHGHGMALGNAGSQGGHGYGMALGNVGEDMEMGIGTVTTYLSANDTRKLYCKLPAANRTIPGIP